MWDNDSIIRALYANSGNPASRPPIGGPPPTLEEGCSTDLIYRSSEFASSTRGGESMSTAAGGQGSSWTAWPARKIPFAFDSGYPYVNDVLNAMNTIQNASRVWFCERGNEANYVLIQNLAGSSFSDVGMRNKGQQLANIQAGYKALHELGHTLGFIHEQDRTDRDTYITIDWANLVDPNSATGSCLAATAVNGNAQFAEDPTCVLLTSYDPHSVMHYPAPATGWQGCPERPAGLDDALEGGSEHAARWRAELDYADPERHHRHQQAVRWDSGLVVPVAASPAR